MSGTLYIVSTPIGNLEDITLRALRVLREVSLICAEDSRVTRKLLSHYDIHTPQLSLHDHSLPARLEAVAVRLEAGDDVAVVTDAGTPGISDPGFQIVRLCVERGIPVASVPGACAAIAALSISGLPLARFVFQGFLSRQRSERLGTLRAIRDDDRCTVIYEAPTRVRATLDEIIAELGPERPMAVAREITKRFEEVVRGTAAEVAGRLAESAPRGEFVLIVGPSVLPGPGERAATVDPMQEVMRQVAQGASLRDAVRATASSHGVPRRELYARALRELVPPSADPNT